MILKFFNSLLRFYLKVFIYCSIFMMMEMFGRFMKGMGQQGFVEVPLWMIIVYMNIAWLDDLMIPFFERKKISKWLQAFYIMIVIYLFELGFGLLFKYGFHLNVWDYSHSQLFGYPVHLWGVVNVYGLITWYGVAWLLLWLYPRVKFMVDSRGISAVKVESNVNKVGKFRGEYYGISRKTERISNEIKERL